MYHLWEEHTFLFPAIRIFTLRRSSWRMRTKTLTMTTDEKEDDTHEQERKDEKNAHTRTRTRGYATRSCHEF